MLRTTSALFFSIVLSAQAIAGTTKSGAQAYSSVSDIDRTVNAPVAASVFLVGKDDRGREISSYSYADLSTGKLGFKTVVGDPRLGALDAWATPSWWDTVLFSDTHGRASIVLAVQISAIGALSGLANPTFSFSVDDGRSVLGSASGGWRVPGGNGSATTSTADFRSTYDPIGDWEQYGKSYFSGTFLVPTETPITFMLGMNTFGATDFAHTAAFSMELPGGVTFQSNSGKFLSAVPESESSKMALMGLLAIMLFLRKQRST